MATQDFLDTALRLAEERGWSRAELARRAGFSNSQFNKWRTGAAVPASSVIAIARALSLDVVAALMQCEALTSEEVSRFAADRTMADLDLVELAGEVYERIRLERSHGSALPDHASASSAGDGHSDDQGHAERVHARRTGRSARPQPAV